MLAIINFLKKLTVAAISHNEEVACGQYSLIVIFTQKFWAIFQLNFKQILYLGKGS